MLLAIEQATGAAKDPSRAKDPAGDVKGKALALDRHGDTAGAILLYEAAIKIYRTTTDADSEFTAELAVTLINKAAGVAALGEDRDAVLLCDEAITILNNLAAQAGLAEVIDYNFLAAYAIKAQAAQRRSDNAEALRHYRMQVELLSRLVGTDTRWQCRYHLAKAYCNVAAVAAGAGSLQDGLTGCDEALHILKGIDEKEGNAAVREEIQIIRWQRDQNPAQFVEAWMRFTSEHDSD